LQGPIDPDRAIEDAWAENLKALNDAAVEVLRKGDVPIIGVNMALPVIESFSIDAIPTAGSSIEAR